MEPARVLVRVVLRVPVPDPCYALLSRSLRTRHQGTRPRAQDSRDRRTPRRTAPHNTEPLRDRHLKGNSSSTLLSRKVSARSVALARSVGAGA